MYSNWTSKEEQDAYICGYEAAKKEAQRIIDKMMETNSILRDTIDQLQAQLQVLRYE